MHCPVSGKMTVVVGVIIVSISLAGSHWNDVIAKGAMGVVINVNLKDSNPKVDPSKCACWS